MNTNDTIKTNNKEFYYTLLEFKESHTEIISDRLDIHYNKALNSMTKEEILKVSNLMIELALEGL